MSDRYTTKDTYAAFTRLASLLGKEWSIGGAVFSGKYWESESVGPLWTREGNQNRSRVGVWCLDHNSTYGGYVIEEIVTDGGGVSHPMGDLRRNAREFCYAVNFAEHALRALPR